ncbi:MAG: glycosyltransferase family 4 protein [Calothrix sp. MO_192.B10]|nr:glycosyltransferase family 4 protein [Calothrix sp. MO_192.B10]
MTFKKTVDNEFNYLTMNFQQKDKSILYLSVYDPHIPLTGTGTRGIEFVNNLSQKFNLDLVYIDGSGQPPISHISEKFSSNLQYVRTKIGIEFSQFNYFVFSRHLYREAHRLIKNNNYSFIICDYGLSAIYGNLLSQKFNLPFVYCSHNIEYLMYLDKVNKDKRRLLLMPYVYWVEKIGVKNSKILVSITKNDAEYYRRWTDKNKIIVIPQGFDSSIFNPFYKPIKNDPKIILFCGNYGIQSNRDVVSIVMDKILEKVLSVYPNTIFRFIGANPPQDVKHPNVEFTGFVDDYPSYLKQADVVISPMQQGRGFPTKIIESLACGKPTIATPIGARAIERDYTSLKVCNFDQFPEMICRVLTEDESVTTSDFEKLKTRYSWDINIQKLTDKIDDLEMLKV